MEISDEMADQMAEEYEKYKDYQPGRPAIYVRCPKCDICFPEKEVKPDDICENVYGEDVVSFVCPECKERVSSLRFSRYFS